MICMDEEAERWFERCYPDMYRQGVEMRRYGDFIQEDGDGCK